MQAQKRLNASTAALPGIFMHEAVRRLHENPTREDLLGQIFTDHMQLCPQNRGFVDEELVDQLLEAFPNTKFRLHANVRVLPHIVKWDASDDFRITKPYFEQMAFISKRLGAPAYTLHAGYKENCDFNTMLDNVARIQELFNDIPVGIEGLYPLAAKPQHMDTWEAYQQVYDCGFFVALDLSHLNLLKPMPFTQAVLRNWLEHKNTIEVHVSDNDGTRDQHKLLFKNNPPFWLNAFNESLLDTRYTTVFSESNQRDMVCQTN